MSLAPTGLRAVAICLSLVPLGASAASVRTFVASTGTDSGACSRAAPCRSFAYAVTQTSPGGELDVLDSGGYGPVTITQGISIINDGNIASVSVPATQTGITVNAGATDTIVLRGLTVEGSNAGYNGITFFAGGRLVVRDCVLQNFATGGTFYQGNGILMQPQSGAPKISIVNTTVLNSKTVGIYLVPPTNGTATTLFDADNVSAIGNVNGFIISNPGGGSVVASVANSVASGNTDNGFAFGGGSVTATLDLSRASGNAAGVYTTIDAQSKLYLSRSVLTGNSTGVKNVFGAILSFQDNRIAGNGTDVSGTVTPATPR